MNFKSMDIKVSYINRGTDSFAKAFLLPMLKYTKTYKRSVGFFSSKVLKSIVEGMQYVYHNNARIMLIVSPMLCREDVEAINTGYQKREEILTGIFDKELENELLELSDTSLKMLVSLIADGILDIKIAVTDTIGSYHDKLGILEDLDGNVVVFVGSANSSSNAYDEINYEKIRISKGWVEGQQETVQDEISEFDALWNGTNPYINTYTYNEGVKANILKVIEQRSSSLQHRVKAPITLYDYQTKAIEKWEKHGYNGFFVMATGTGKTWTAIYAAKRLLQKHPAIIVICAPYKHLIKQWVLDLEKVFNDAKIIMVSGENPKRFVQITTAIIGQKYNSMEQTKQIIIVSTIASFNTEQFKQTLFKSKQEKLLIVDEAHRFKDRSEILHEQFSYMIGLSATPYNGLSATSGKELIDFFGGEVINLPIEVALSKGCLVPYNYHPIYVHATGDEEKKFQQHSRIITSCFDGGKCIDVDTLITQTRARLRVISMSSEKMTHLREIFENINAKNHFIVYCGDSKLFDDNGNEFKHLEAVKRVLVDLGYKASKFTAQESMDERMSLIKTFNDGDISTLVAIRCLDEGINIPSITKAIILSSNDNYREFVQRRGRILRKDDERGKLSADIYDVIVLPSQDMSTWAKIEFRRFYEYAKLSDSWMELKSEFMSYLNYYSLELKDVDVYDYDEMEIDINEDD